VARAGGARPRHVILVGRVAVVVGCDATGGEASDAAHDEGGLTAGLGPGRAALPEDAAGLLGVLEFESDLRQDADEEFVHVVVYSDRRFDVLAVVLGSGSLALCNNPKNTELLRQNFHSSRRFTQLPDYIIKIP